MRIDGFNARSKNDSISLLKMIMNPYRRCDKQQSVRWPRGCGREQTGSQEGDWTSVRKGSVAWTGERQEERAL